MSSQQQSPVNNKKLFIETYFVVWLVFKRPNQIGWRIPNNIANKWNAGAIVCFNRLWPRLEHGTICEKTKWKKDSISITWFQRRATLNSRWYSQLMSSTSLSSLFPTALWTSHFTIPSWYLREIFGITCEWPFEKIQSKRIKFMLKSSKSKWAHTLLLEE